MSKFRGARKVGRRVAFRDEESRCRRKLVGGQSCSGFLCDGEMPIEVYLIESKM